MVKNVMEENIIMAKDTNGGKSSDIIIIHKLDIKK